MADAVRKRKWDQEEDVTGGAGKAVKLEDGTFPNAAGGSGMSSAAEVAREAAARIAAQLGKASGESSRPVAPGEELAFHHDVDINDSRNRYLLTRGSTQEQVKAETGANVITKGTWLPDRSKATEKDPPLYLHITGTTQAIVDAGVAAVQKLLDSDLGPLVTNFRDKNREDQPRERRKWPEEKLPVGLETLRNFNVRAKIVGPQGLFVKHIQQETGARVQIKGQGSGFVESDTGRESDEPMHVHISGPEQIMVDRAKDLAEDLLIVVREKWAEARNVLEGGNSYGGYQPPPPDYNAPAPPPPGGAYPAPPAAGAPPPPPPGAGPPGGDPVTEAQALAPEIDRSLLEFYAGHSQDPATIVYYARMALYYQSQGYTGQGQPPAGSPDQAQMQQAMNAYGTPTQAGYGYGQQAPAPGYTNPGYGDSHQDYGRQGKGSYSSMPPPPGL